jgi:glycosyltransferase involved in cell wall biosynthesis
MKIAVIGAKGLPPRQGGIEHYCAELYPRIVENGHQVDVFARTSCTELPAFYRHDYKGVGVVSLPCPGLKGLDALASSALGAIVSSYSQYDIVHFHALGPSLFSWLPKFSNPKTKVVVTCHGLDWQREKWGKLSSRMIRWGEKSAAQFADNLIVVSDDLKQYFLKTYGRDIAYIPNAPASYAPCDTNFQLSQSLGLTAGRYLLYLGRLVPEKCPDLLIQAFREGLLPADWKLVFVGGTSDTNAFGDNLAQLAKGCPNIVFAGELRGGRLAEIVRNAGLFVSPSNLEGLPLAMLEGMAEAVPIVASNIPPHQQLLGEDRGIMFQAGNVKDCAAKLAWAIQHPQAMAQMAQVAQQHVQQYYTWERITTDHLALYNALMPVPTKVRARSLASSSMGDRLGSTVNLRSRG